uniref:F-box domain-containing protein n=1 Tax=Ascaris lumbricoides TaxID=6252 RepID=A0A0M3HXA2_ASCLU
MATIVDSLPDVILAIMGLLGLIRVRRCSNAFAAAASLFGVEEAELYRQVELFIVDRWEELFAALDVYGRGRQYFGLFFYTSFF